MLSALVISRTSQVITSATSIGNRNKECNKECNKELASWRVSLFQLEVSKTIVSRQLTSGLYKLTNTSNESCRSTQRVWQSSLSFFRFSLLPLPDMFSYQYISLEKSGIWVRT